MELPNITDDKRQFDEYEVQVKLEEVSKETFLDQQMYPHDSSDHSKFYEIDKHKKHLQTNTASRRSFSDIEVASSDIKKKHFDLLIKALTVETGSLQNHNTEEDVFGKFVSTKLKNISHNDKITKKRKILDILYK